MSLDISASQMVETEVFSEGCTANLVPIWKASGLYDTLYNSEGKLAGGFIIDLEKGLSKLMEDPERYRRLEPQNKCGTYDQAISFICRLIANCSKYPMARIHTS